MLSGGWDCDGLVSRRSGRGSAAEDHRLLNPLPSLRVLLGTSEIHQIFLKLFWLRRTSSWKVSLCHGLHSQQLKTRGSGLTNPKHTPLSRAL